MIKKMPNKNFNRLIASIVFTGSGALIMQVNEDITINSWLIYKAVGGAIGFILFCTGMYGIFKYCFSTVLKK